VVAGRATSAPGVAVVEAGAGRASDRMTAPPVVASDEGVRVTTLENGLTVLSERMPGVRSVAIGAWIRAASAHETPSHMGVSHLLEHMVFKGTESRSAREIALSLERLGGSLDAYTSREHTAYQARVLDEHVGIAADVLADLVFRPTLRYADLVLERKVIIEEIGMVEDTPDDLVFELHNAALWGAHPYGYSILGSRETISALGVRDLRALHGRAYHPAQTVLAAAGSIDHDRLLSVLEQAGWMALPAGPTERLVTPVPTAAPPTVTHVEREGAQTHIVFGSAAMAHNDPRRYAFALASSIFGGGMSSRLFQRIREEMGLAYSVYTFSSMYAAAGVHGVYVATAPETAAQAADAVRESMARLAADGLDAEELEAGRNQLKGSVTLSLESVTSRMYRAAGVELYGEPYRPLDEELARIDAIHADDVAAVCREFFAPERQTVLSLGPA